MVRATVLRGHAGGHLVYSDELGITLLCSTRGRLKKEKASVVTGDVVEVEVIDKTAELPSGNIVQCLPRRNLLPRPKIANIDQAVLVQAVHQPEFNTLLFDRYLVHCQIVLPNTQLLLCFNKCDLASDDELAILTSIYSNLGYPLVMASATLGSGLTNLCEHLTGKVSVLIGPSGVGKSSLVNRLDPELALRTGIMENEFGVGRHTTTYSELYPIKFLTGADGASGWVADTPGFSLTELKHPEPQVVASKFWEIAQFGASCKYDDCLHTVEDDCNVLANLKQIAPSRYESYKTLVAEATNEANKQKGSSQKTEATVKRVGGNRSAVLIPKLNFKSRAASRNTTKQRLVYEEDDSDLDKLDE